jgi:[NiFe] hydrogenase diaphorase moiety large subunit
MMQNTDRETLNAIVASHGKDRTRLFAMVQAVQARLGHVPDEAIDHLANCLGMHRVEVADTVSFYAFLDRQKKGDIHIRLTKTPLSKMQGAQEVAQAFEEALGIRMGQTTRDGKFSLSWTSDIGMADQEPSALVNGVPLTRITVADVEPILTALRGGGSSGASVVGLTPANLPNALVGSSLVSPGPVLFGPMNRGAGLRAALNMTPDQVIEVITRARLRGRGGAGFPTGMKWKACRQARGSNRYIICNADEGEPGTFKDRVLLTEVPDRVFAGMTIAGYALGAREGIVYLRGEYSYLWNHLQQTLAQRRRQNLLGKDICGLDGFEFDIRIELGAGAYICGEESALIESLEGKRGAPRDRPPFPTERGYLQQPTSVNNVETLACVTRILEKGADWFTQFGTKESTGTKLLSVAGDCEHPGVYEVPFGITVNEVLDLVGGGNAEAVQVSGPSGQCVAPKDFGRQLCFEDLPTGGSTMVFGPQRDLLDIVCQFAEFFAEEACGWCVPCRVGTTVFVKLLEKILHNRGTLQDVQQLESLCRTVGRTSRCGLGQTAPNPILSTLRNFPHLWEARIKKMDFIPVFDLEQSLRPAIAVQGRLPVSEEHA